MNSDPDKDQVVAVAELSNVINFLAEYPSCITYIKRS